MLSISLEDVNKFYGALKTFNDIMYREENVFSHKLEEGEMMMIMMMMMMMMMMEHVYASKMGFTEIQYHSRRITGKSVRVHPG